MQKNAINFQLVFPYKRKVTYRVRPECRKRQEALSAIYSRFNQLFDSARFGKQYQYAVFTDSELRRALLRGEMPQLEAQFERSYTVSGLSVELKNGVFMKRNLRRRILAGQSVTPLQALRKLNPLFVKKFLQQALDAQWIEEFYLQPDLKKAVNAGRFKGDRLVCKTVRQILGIPMS
jgi:hypothetical protein